MDPVLVLLLAALQPAPVVAVFEIQDMRMGGEKLDQTQRAALTSYLRNLLAEGGAMKVVPSAGLRRAMLDAKKESYEQCFDEACQIEIGKAVSASKLVTTKIIQVGRRCIVTSTLFDLRSETTDRAEHHKGGCDEEALGGALEKVSVKLRAGRAHDALDREEKDPERWEPSRRGRVIVSFGSEPPGAVVLIDGELACQDSARGCERALRPGPHRVQMQKERYVSRDEQVTVTDGSRVVWELEPSFGSVVVRSEPPGIAVRVDGRNVGRTPVTAEVDPGEHVVTLADRCYYESRRTVTVVRARSEKLDMEVVPREGAIDLTAVDADGNAVRADVFVDGKHAGVAPDLIRVNVCAEKIRVVSSDHGAWEEPISIAEKETREIEARLDAGLPEKKEEGVEVAKKEKPPTRAFRLGPQLMMGLLCLEAQQSGGSSKCVDTNTGYGGAISVQWPVDPESSGWIFHGSLRAGFLYYPSIQIGKAAYEIPVGLAVEAGVGGGGEYGIGGEALYVYRSVTGPAPELGTTEELARYDALAQKSPHAFDLGLYGFVRFVSAEIGAGIYVPLAGLGETILVRFWIGYGLFL